MTSSKALIILAVVMEFSDEAIVQDLLGGLSCLSVIHLWDCRLVV